MQVVEVGLRYDDICLPDDYKHDAVAYIKDEKVGKTCPQNLIVSKNVFFI
jgi:hypothetical protein